MNAEVLIQNVFNLFIIAIILEASIMAIFSMSAMKDISDMRPITATRDMVILLVSFFICYKVDMLSVFRGSGVKLPMLLDTLISALVLMRMTNFIREFLGRMRFSE